MAIEPNNAASEQVQPAADDTQANATPEQKPGSFQQAFDAAAQKVGMGTGPRMGQESPNKEEEPARFETLKGERPMPVQYAIEWLEGNSVQRADMQYFKDLIANLCKQHDVEPEMVQIALAPVKHASLLDSRKMHSEELSSELGLVDMAVLVPVVGKPIGMMQLGSMLTFTTTAEWESHVRIGSKPFQRERIVYLTDPTLRQNQYLTVQLGSPFGAAALMVLTNSRKERELKDIERLWDDIRRRYSMGRRQEDARLASQVVVKFQRIISPVLRSNHTLLQGIIKGEVWSPGADSKLQFGFEVRTELESVDQGNLMEVIGSFEVDRPTPMPAPIYQPLSVRQEKPLGGKTVDTGSAANPIPDTDAPKTDPTTQVREAAEAAQQERSLTPSASFGSIDSHSEFVKQITSFQTHVWAFFNHAMAGIIEMLEEEDRREQARNAVRYIDNLYHHKGISSERYEVTHDPMGELKILVVNESTEKKVVEFSMSVL